MKIKTLTIVFLALFMLRVNDLFLVHFMEPVVVTDRKEFYDWIHDNYQWVKSLDEIPNIRNIRFENIVSLGDIFAYMDNLKDISALASWDVSQVCYFDRMFMYCEKLKSLRGLENWDVSNSLTFSDMFYKCDSLKDISALSHWNVSNSMSFDRMFYCAKDLDVSALSSWDVSNSLSFGYMLSWNPKNIETLSHWNISKARVVKGMFGDNSKETLERLCFETPKCVIYDDDCDERYGIAKNIIENRIRNEFEKRNKNKIENKTLSNIAANIYYRF